MGSKVIVLFLLKCLVGGTLTAYKGLYSGHINFAHETIPQKVTPNGEHLSHNLTHYHDDGAVHFNVTIDQRSHMLVLEPALHFIAPGLIIERRKLHLHMRYKPKKESHACQYQGFVHGHHESRVAVAACNGLAGVIHLENDRYYIEPAHHQTKTISPGQKHLIYKRSTSASNNHKKKRRKKRRKRELSNCGTKDPKRLTRLEWQRQLGKVKVQEKERKHKRKHKIKITGIEDSQLKKHKYKKIERKKRSISKPHYVETLLVADRSMVEFHESENGDIETYLLTLMNMVSFFYMDPSIGNLINVVVVKIILLDDVDENLNVTSNGHKTLNSFCEWQKSLNPTNDSHPHHHDVALLMTRLNICMGNDNCTTLGVAHIGGMCRSGRSCSFNEDNGISSAYTLAHEMGHNFGMYHDTKDIGCTGIQGNIKHIMAPSFVADTGVVSWSNCSRRMITNFLDRGLGKCLHDQPEDQEDYEYAELPPGAVYNSEHQCRLQHGPEATVCSSEDEICTRLWCMVNDTCRSLMIPAAPGTQCGKHKWCQDTKCVPMMDPPVPIDGGWGEWSSWSECSRTCGAGVSVMKRDCDHPRPAAGGKFCVGERRRYVICNPEPCPEDEPTFRATQCSAYNNDTHEWLPYFDRDQPCTLYCTDINETIIVPIKGYAADGTSCNVITRDVCVEGICKNVGCDWVVDSKAKEDECGICQGDGTKCDKKEGVYYKQSLFEGYKEVVVIPPGARNIKIEEKNPTRNYISIGAAYGKKFYLNGKRLITLPGEYTVAGAQALYERDQELDKVRIPGPIQEAIVVYVLYRGHTYNPGVEYRYSIWKPETTKQLKYSWIMGLWSQCSKTCGGGVQHREPLCQESTVATVAFDLESPTMVDEYMCEPSERPKKLMRTCNDDPCPYHWWVGPWQSCPVTCHDDGDPARRRRSVMCVDGQEMALPDSFCDRKAKPFEYQPCKAGLPPCDQDRK